MTLEARSPLGLWQDDLRAAGLMLWGYSAWIREFADCQMLFAAEETDVLFTYCSLQVCRTSYSNQKKAESLSTFVLFLMLLINFHCCECLCLCFASGCVYVGFPDNSRSSGGNHATVRYWTLSSWCRCLLPSIMPCMFSLSQMILVW